MDDEISKIAPTVAVKVLIRHLIVAAGGGLVAVGVASPEAINAFASSAADIATGALLFGATYGWSIFEKKRAAVKVASAIFASAETGTAVNPGNSSCEVSLSKK